MAGASYLAAARGEIASAGWPQRAHSGSLLSRFIPHSFNAMPLSGTLTVAKTNHPIDCKREVHENLTRTSAATESAIVLQCHTRDHHRHITSLPRVRHRVHLDSKVSRQQTTINNIAIIKHCASSLKYRVIINKPTANGLTQHGHLEPHCPKLPSLTANNGYNKNKKLKYIIQSSDTGILPNNFRFKGKEAEENPPVLSRPLKLILLCFHIGLQRRVK